MSFVGPSLSLAADDEYRRGRRLQVRFRCEFPSFYIILAKFGNSDANEIKFRSTETVGQVVSND